MSTKPAFSIDGLVNARRLALGRAGTQAQRPWGLALSGGGIRSATFCFGLLRALARDRLLLRFDLLSTVSGGGYIGAMLGRLLQRAGSRQDVETIVDRLHHANPRWFAWWLRANGRYLVPSGARDTAFAAALYLRNMVGVHVELGVLGLLLGAALTALDLAVWQGLALLVDQQGNTVLSLLRSLPQWLPTVWLSLPLLAWMGAVLACAFWSVPWVSRRARAQAQGLWATLRDSGWPSTLCRALIAGAALAALLWGRSSALGAPAADAYLLRYALWALAVVSAITWLPALALARHWAQAAPQRPQARNRLTEGLALLLRLGIGVMVLGALDRVAWFLAFEARNLPLSTMAAGLAVAAALLRAVLPQLSSLRAKASGPGALLRLGGLLGYLATFALLACWVALVQSVALGALPADATGDAAGSRSMLDFHAGWVGWAWVTLPVLIYAVLSGFNVGFLNQSSLHGFYRARLARSYLGAANPARFGSRQPLGATEQVPAGASGPKAVTDVMADDDLPFADYAPHAHGGPVHLIGVCLNQTKDPRGGLYNQDRRGHALTLAPGGRLRVGQQDWQTMRPEAALSLGGWTAISGAAVAPGLGAMTRGGISALAMFSGLRLGFWWDSSGLVQHQVPPRWPGSKLAGVLGETLGNFKGAEGRDWFLTDGGHFENTGAYALLAEEAEVIVLADCGADPNYCFDDLENLVRKARIDLQAEVRFQKPRSDAQALLPLHPSLQDLLGQFGSLGDLASNTSLACFALAELRYRREIAGAPAERLGHLILVKPNLCAGLPVDLVNFKAKQADFPQQSTADQFFDESQWESYFQLGSVLGSRLTEPGIEGLLAQAATLFVRDDGTPVAEAAAPEGSTPAAAKPAAEAIRRIPERIAAGSVTATLSLGAVATVGVSAWQGIDSWRAASSQRLKDQRAALKELTDLWAPAAKASPGIDTEQQAAQTAALAAALARMSDTLCAGGDADWFVESPLASEILEHTVARCEAGPRTRSEPACQWLRTDTSTMTPSGGASCLMLGIAKLSLTRSAPCHRYWGYDYAERAETRCAHPGDPQVEQRLAFGQQTMQQQAQDLLTLQQQRAARTPSTPATSAEPAKATKPVPVPAEPAPAASAAAPAAPPASAPASASASGPTPTAATNTQLCSGQTIYLQAYGREQRDSVGLAYRSAWQGLGATVPAVEDVVASALARGGNAPRPVSATTVRYHDVASLACASALAAQVDQRDWRVEPLSPALKPRRNVIEVWIAPPGR